MRQTKTFNFNVQHKHNKAFDIEYNHEKYTKIRIEMD